jgi:hypothetical protein
MGRKYDYIDFRCVFPPISLIFFANRALFSLNKSPTKFREAEPSRYRNMWKWGKIMIISIFGALVNTTQVSNLKILSSNGCMRCVDIMSS